MKRAPHPSHAELRRSAQRALLIDAGRALRALSLEVTSDGVLHVRVVVDRPLSETERELIWIVDADIRADFPQLDDAFCPLDIIESEADFEALEHLELLVFARDEAPCAGPVEGRGPLGEG